LTEPARQEAPPAEFDVDLDDDDDDEAAELAAAAEEYALWEDLEAHADEIFNLSDLDEVEGLVGGDSTSEDVEMR